MSVDHALILNPLLACAERLGLELQTRAGREELWNRVLERCEYVSNAYTQATIDYQHEYQLGQGGDWLDASVIIYWGTQTGGVWPLSISRRDGMSEISSQGQPIRAPLFTNDVPASSIRELTRLCLDLLYATANTLGIKNLLCSDSFANASGLSEWHVQSVARGASCSVQYDLFLKTCSVEAIESGFRKKLRYTIRQGCALWQAGLLNSRSSDVDSVWDEFKELHLQVSGRKTRSDRSWQLQRDSIRSDEGFLVYLRDKSERMIGAGYFTLSRDEGLYAVAAYDRGLFDQPISHVVQHEALRQFVGRSIPWYLIGTLPVVSDAPHPTDKERSIGRFKKQFSSHVFPKYILKHDVTAQTSDLAPASAANNGTGRVPRVGPSVRRTLVFKAAQALRVAACLSAVATALEQPP